MFCFVFPPAVNNKFPPQQFYEWPCSHFLRRINQTKSNLLKKRFFQSSLYFLLMVSSKDLIYKSVWLIIGISVILTYEVYIIFHLYISFQRCIIASFQKTFMIFQDQICSAIYLLHLLFLRSREPKEYVKRVMLPNGFLEWASYCPHPLSCSAWPSNYSVWRINRKHFKYFI